MTSVVKTSKALWRTQSLRSFGGVSPIREPLSENLTGFVRFLRKNQAPRKAETDNESRKDLERKDSSILQPESDKPLEIKNFSIMFNVYCLTFQLQRFWLYLK